MSVICFKGGLTQMADGCSSGFGGVSGIDKVIIVFTGQMRSSNGCVRRRWVSRFIVVVAGVIQVFQTNNQCGQLILF